MRVIVATALTWTDTIRPGEYFLELEIPGGTGIRVRLASETVLRDLGILLWGYSQNRHRFDAIEKLIEPVEQRHEEGINHPILVFRPIQP